MLYLWLGARRPTAPNHGQRHHQHWHACSQLHGTLPKKNQDVDIRGDDASKTNNFFSLKTIWENTVQIAAFTAIPASQHGYGMAATNNDALAHLLTDAVSNFGMAYATTQESLTIECRQNLGNSGAASNALPGSQHRPVPTATATMPTWWMRPRPATRWPQRRQQWQ